MGDGTPREQSRVVAMIELLPVPEKRWVLVLGEKNDGS